MTVLGQFGLALLVLLATFGLASGAVSILTWSISQSKTAKLKKQVAAITNRAAKEAPFHGSRITVNGVRYAIGSTLWDGTLHVMAIKEDGSVESLSVPVSAIKKAVKVPLEPTPYGDLINSIARRYVESGESKNGLL
jgi:hypothetical protein